MKVLKALTFLLTLITSYSGFTEPEIDPQPLPKTQQTSTSSSVLSAIGTSLENLIPDTEDDIESAPKKHLNFEHYGFYTSKITRNRQGLRARILHNQKDLNRYLSHFKATSFEHRPVDFNTHMLLAIEQTDRWSWALQIQSIDSQNHYGFNIKTKISSASCQDHHKPQTTSHLVILSKTKPEKLAMGFQVLSHTTVPECYPLSEDIQEHYLNSQTLLASKAIQPPKKTNAYVLSKTWGEWDVLRTKHCPSCSDLYVPGLPNSASLLSVVDTPSKQGESRNVFLRNLQTTSQHWILHLERIIHHCEKSLTSPDTSILAFAAPPRPHLKFAKIAPGFVPESHIFCENSQKL